jgi:transposase
MHYKDHIITSVRKVRHDNFWHIYYLVYNYDKKSKRETYDRVTREEAMRVIAEMNKSETSLLRFIH